MEWSYDGVRLVSGSREDIDDENICPLCDCLEDILVESTVTGCCATNNSYGLKQGDFHRPGTQKVLFHEACPRCPDTLEDDLCPRCKHMRLRHLIQCLLLNESESDIAQDALHGWIPNRLDDIYLSLGSIQDLEEHSHYCNTCRITIGGVRCSFGMSLQLKSSQERLKSDTSSSHEMFKNWFIDRKYFLGTIEPISGQDLVSKPLPQQTVDWQKVSEWIRYCHDSAEHKNPCQRKPAASHITGLRVIDTRQRCITIAPVTCRYAALSYVWGATSTRLQATTKNIEQLAMEGFLESKILPQTIDDAIVACRRLAIEYLWVDCLCILQDDDPDRKAYWLNSMGDIYAQSYITIVALAGDDAKHGIPGVNMGWTFQEGRLATRQVLFSDTSVFYKCSHHRAMHDELYGYSEEGSKERTASSSYETAVEEFTKRELTWEGDILRAFAGVLQTEWGPDNSYGIPLNMFCNAILWTSRGGTYPTRLATSGDVFPTWSWSSIKNQIEFKSARYDRALWEKFRGSLAIWAIPSRLTRRPALRVVANTLGESEGFDELDELKSLNWRDEENIPEDMKEFILARLAVVMAWKRGCFSGALPKILNTTTTWKEYENIVGQWRSLAQLCDEAHGMPRGSMSKQDMDARFPLSMRQDCPFGSIFVYTQSLDLNPLKMSAKHRINHAHQRETAVQFNLLALSVTPHNRMDVACVAPEKGDFWYDSAGEGLCDTTPESFGVELMIVETENGISRRVGLAWAILKHWINQNPQFRTFHLV
ncbi:HET-domain-containing protein [Aspergillus costaricaensis CBS 115574]|uniref:HET-domain-containing protein n=1 Tax=Aspergillus costaricaensis CBS 115574 TaxID=1448317 RepID=A0ACD1ILD9_9EURO|nr:HET-domain-containing protein [Aspergillus costaricaensis CBS 115574]RAK90920.1 HET-domain-containing protein [Aspergillus costaricaensis CBS 115574]